MKVLPLMLTAAARYALSQSFEPADFNITEILLKNGVDASVLPELSTLTERNVYTGCFKAVSLT